MEMIGKKIIEVAVVVGKGEQDFFIEKEIVIPPTCPPVYKVKDINEWVEVYDMKMICGRVLFNAYLWKDITYKVAEKVCDESVCGPVYHDTVKIPFGGFVEVCPDGKDGDIPVLLSACIEGKRDDWRAAPEKCGGVKGYNKLVEKTVVRLKFKVTRMEQLCIEGARTVDPDERDEPCSCGKQGHPEEP